MSLQQLFTQRTAFSVLFNQNKGFHLQNFQEMCFKAKTCLELVFISTNQSILLKLKGVLGKNLQNPIYVAEGV